MFSSRRIAMSRGDNFRNEKSLAFDGTNDYVSVGSTFQSTLRSDFSFSIWVKPSDGQPGGMSNDVLFGTHDGNYMMYLAILTSGKVKFLFQAGGVLEICALTSDYAIFADGQNDWTHLVLTADVATVDGLKLYVNGVLHTDASSTGASSLSWHNFTTNNNLFIGAYNDDGTAGNHFPGGMSDFALYNRVLTANQVRTIYNDRKAFNHKDWDFSIRLVSWLKLGDGTLDKWGGNPDASFNSFLITDEKNPTIENDVITNGTFASDSGWTKGSGWSISGGTASRASGESSNSAIEHAGDAITADRTYKYSFDFDIASGNCSAFIGGTSLDSSFNGSGTNSGYVTAVGGGEFTLYGLTSAEVTSVDNVQAWLIGGAAGTTVNMDGADIVGDIP